MDTDSDDGTGPQDQQVINNEHPVPQGYNPRPQQRPRTMETPIDSTLVGTRAMGTHGLSLTDLLDDDIELRVNMNRSHLNVQILRIITPKPGSNSATTRYQRGGQSQKIVYVRIILCRHENKLCYIFINHEQNRRLFHRDLLLRDNGIVTIGTFMRLLAPHPVLQEMQGIPMVRSDTPAVIMSSPNHYPPYSIAHELSNVRYGVAILNGVDISIHRTQAIQTKCTGKHCDRQRPQQLLNQGCGCWGTSGIGITNLALLHTVVVDTPEPIMMRNFSSNKFNLDTFQDRPFPQNVQVTALEHTDASDALEDAITRCVNYINNHGGFTVVMWYSRGEINDTSLLGLNTQSEEAQVDSGKINYHFVQIIPFERAFLNQNSIMNRALNNLKFNVGTNL